MPILLEIHTVDAEFDSRLFLLDSATPLWRIQITFAGHYLKILQISVTNKTEQPENWLERNEGGEKKSEYFMKKELRANGILMMGVLELIWIWIFEKKV